MSHNAPFVSVIVPAYNCEKTISKSIDSLLSLNYPNYEVIIVDDGSMDSTPKILKDYGDKIIVIQTKNLGPSHARNIAVKQTKGEYVAFTDSDCIVDKNWLMELFKGYGDEKVVGVGGDQLSPEDEIEFGKDVQTFMKAVGFVSDYLKTHKKIIETKHNPTCNVMYKKNVLLEVGLFDENLWPGEDVEIDLKIKKIGYKLYYNPDAIVYHYRPANNETFSRMMKRYGWAQAYLLRKHGLFRVIQLEPFLLIIFLFLIIFFLSKNIIIGIGLLILFSLLTFVWLIIKAKNLRKGLIFITLFIRLLYYWNIGFVSYFLIGTNK